MPLSHLPIRRKLVAIILLTSCAALLLTCAAYSVVEYVTFRQNTRQNLSTLGRVMAANSTAALAFDDENAAREILAALKAEPHVVAAGLYDGDGKLVAQYPTNASAGLLPPPSATNGFRFERGYLVGCLPVSEGSKRLGTLCLKSDMGAMYQRFRLIAGIAALVMAASLLLAYLLSRALQQQVSRPILALVDAAREVSARQDYSVRAVKFSSDELGLLTDSFNQMLGQIQRQTSAVTESETRTRAVLDSAISAVVVMDAAGKIVDWNDRAVQIFGWSRAEALGQPLGDTIIPPRYREAHKLGLERFLAGGESRLFGRVLEMSALRRDGSEFPVELSISPLRAGNVTTFCGFITDITERKFADQKLQTQLARLALLSRTTRAIGERQDLQSIFQVVIRSLEDNLPIDFGCVCVYDGVQETLTVVSAGVKSRPLAIELGLDNGAVLEIDGNGLGRCVRGELVYEPEVGNSQFPFPRRLARGGLGALVIAPLLVESQVFGVLVAARREAGSFSSPDCEFLRQLSEHAALAAHQAQLYDALQRAYNDLRRTQQTVMQQERLRALGQMASGIAHDINNAISPVSLYTESLLEKEPNLSPRARDYLQTISRAIDDVAATVARMREFYRQREAQLSLAPVNLNELVQQVLDLTRARWSDMPQQRGVVIESSLALAPELPAIMGVESEIREALTNLIFNAVDAMPDGGKLTLRTSTAEDAAPSAETPAARHVLVEVTDTGVGMDEDTRRRCLEPFFTTKGERGTGLGLAMVYGVMQRHSADIEIESAPNRGTTFRLVFAVPATVTPGAATPVSAPLITSRMRVLVVDDDPMLLKSLRDALEGDGHVVTTANGGQAGVETFREACGGAEPFRVVITDLGMPHVDGRMVARAIKAASPDTPVIMLTGWGRRLQAEGDIPPHVDQVLNKPPKLNELREALARAAQKSAG